jgi:methylase of polypeptide subunit release factors
MTISGRTAEAEGIAGQGITEQSPTVPAVTDPDCCQRILDVLARANYTDKGVSAALGIENLGKLRERRLPALLRRTSGETQLENLIRLFVLGQPVGLAAARRAVAPMSLEEWSEMKLVNVSGASVTGCLQLRCYEGLVFSYDFPRRGPGGLPQDYVMGVSPSSLVLAGMTIRHKNVSTLDLGSGCGIQAILAASHSERVVGVDCNPRAIGLARFNAKLNGIDHIEFREGDLFEPVENETFDLIVSNPPFIISPENRHFFLNSGLEGDEICRRIVQQAPRYLEDGGYCILNANWAVIDQEDWRVRLANWFEGTGCDGLVLVQDAPDLGDYAASLIQLENHEEAEYLRLFNKWMDYYAKHKIVGIGQGVIVMRRAAGRRNWFAVESVPSNISYPAGADVAQLVELRTFLHSLRREEDFLDVHLKLAPNVRLEQVCEPAGGSWRPISGRVRRVGGLEYSGSLDGSSAAALARWDETRPLRDYLSELATALGMDLSNLLPAAVPIIRRLVEQGFLLPREAGKKVDTATHAEFSR